MKKLVWVLFFLLGIPQTVYGNIYTLRIDCALRRVFSLINKDRHCGLSTAVSDGDVERLVDLLESNNVSQDECVKLLVIAIRENQPRIIRVLIDGRINLNTGVSTRALHIAAFEGTDGAVKVLLDAGVDLNAVDGNGDTPLRIAMQRNHARVIELLVSAGADVDIVDGSGRTPRQAIVENLERGQGVTSLLRDRQVYGKNENSKRRRVGRK